MSTNTTSGTAAFDRERVRRWFRNAARKARHLFQPRKAKEPPSREEKDRLEQLRNKVKQSFPTPASRELPDNLQKELHEQLTFCAEQGFYDGVSGRGFGFINLFARTTATSLNARRQAAINTTAAEWAPVVVERQERLHRHQRYRAYLNTLYQYGSLNPLVVEFLLYSVLYVLLVFADLPLAVQTLKWLMGTPTNEVMDGEWFSRENIGTLLMGLGLALSSVFFKIFYDKYISAPHVQRVLSEEAFEALAPSGEYQTAFAIPPTSGRHIHDTKRSKAMAVAVDGVLLIFTIATIIVVGQFRSEARKAEDKVNTTQSLPNPPTNTGGKAEGGQAEEIDLNARRTAAMTCMTLLFTVVGGVCLSHSMRAWGLYNRVQEADGKSKVLEKDVQDAIKQGGWALAEVDAALKASSSLFAASWEADTRTLLTAYYQMGYADGASAPDYFVQSLDFVDQVAHWRNQSTARLINFFT